jgi:hypothetical protein
MNNQHIKHRRQFLEYSRILSNFHESIVNFYETNLDEDEGKTSLHPTLESYIRFYLSQDCKDLLSRIQNCSLMGTGQCREADLPEK